MLIIGKVLKPQGIKGEIKIISLLDTVDDFSSVNSVFIQEKQYSVEEIRLGGNFVFMKLKNIDSMDKAEMLRGKDVFIEDRLAPKLDEGRYYISHLIGCSVYVGSELMGTVKEIYQYGSADVYELEGSKGKILFPFLKKLILNVDIESKKIELDVKEFDKVAIYED